MGHLGITRNNPDYYALQVLDIILGWGPGFTSRIPAHLRDEQGLAYTTYSTITATADLYPGLFMAYMGTKSENVEKGVQGILKEIALLKEKGVSQEELQTAQSYLTGSFVFNFETNAQMVSYLIQNELYSLGSDYPQTYLESIQKVTQEDVLRVARHYLDEKNYSLVIVEPE